jgi:nitroreductase
VAQNAREVTRFLRRLRAVREYTSEPVSDEPLADILEVARWSGSASNRQPTEVIVVRDAAVRQKIADNGARAAAGAPVALLIVVPDDPTRAELDAFDNGRLVERLLLAAKAHGLGSNIMTLKAEGPKLIARDLGVPPDRKLWTVVTLGHTDEAARRARPANPNAGRKPPGTFVHRERY